MIASGLFGALWNPPFGSDPLMTENSDITGTERPGFLFSLAATSRLSLVNLDRDTNNSQSYMSFGMYPDLCVSTIYKRFGIFFQGQQILDAVSVDKKQNNLRDLDIYQLALGGTWRLHEKISVSLTYRHHLGRMYWKMVDSSTTSTLRMFGHSPCFYGNIGFMLSPKLHVLAGVNVPLALAFKGSVDMNDAPVGARLTLPLSLEGGVSFLAKERFSLRLSATYIFNSQMDSLYLDTQEDSLGFTTLSLYDRNTFYVKVQAGYRVIESLTVRLLGEYSLSGFLRLDTLWPDPGTLNLGAETVLSQGAWDFSLLLGSEKFHPLASSSGEVVSGNSIVLRFAVTRRI